MSDEERPEEFESDDAPVQVVRRRLVKRKGSPRKALSQKKTKDANTDMQAMASASGPPHYSPAHPLGLPSQAQSQPTFVPLATLPALFQPPMMNSTAHVPLQHIATPPAAGSHVSTLSLLNSLQDDKLALILPILVRMEHKIDQLVAMMGSRANLGTVASQSTFPVAAGQPIASMTGSQTNAVMMGSQSSANMTSTHPNAQMIGSQPNNIMGTQVNVPMVGSQPNVMMGSQSNATMMVNQTHASGVGNQPNVLTETQSNSSVIAAQPNFQVIGSLSNAAMGNQLNPQLMGNQPNAVMGTQSKSTLTGTQSNVQGMGRQASGVMAELTQPNSEMVGTHSNTPAISKQVNAVMGTQSNSALTGTQPSVQMLADQSTANTVGTPLTTQIVASPSSAGMMGSQYGVHMNGVQSSTQTVASPSNTSVMSSQANASMMGTKSNATNLANQRHSTVMASPAKIETSGEELRLVVGPEFALNPDEIIALRVRANSAMNFAVKMMRKIFSRDELVGRNISGVRGKDKVDEKRVNIIRELVFKLYQTSPLEKETVWRNCHKAMDSYLRKMHHETSA